MKKNLFYLFALVCSLSLFTACSDDDEKKELTLSQVIENNLVGTYSGKLAIAVNGTDIATDIDQNISLTKSTSAENAVKLELKNFEFMGMTIGDIVVEPCMVKETNGVYSFEGSQTLTLAFGACPVQVSGSISGSNIDIEIGVTVEALQQDVDVTFVGTKAN